MSQANREKKSFGKAGRDRLVGFALALVMLLVTIFMQPWLRAQRATIVPPTDRELRTLAVEFPRLTLGGMRGLLAMVLWIRAENLKHERKWVELQTHYTMVGKLQPYFATVYIFNAWNQAYNLSAQWQSVDEKYRWVVGGLDHLYTGELYSPQNPDLRLEQGHLYFLKLGGSFERVAYRSRWRYDQANQFVTQREVTPGAPRDMAQDITRQVGTIILRPEFKTRLLRDDAEAIPLGHGIEISDLLPNQKEPLRRRYGVSVYYYAYRAYQRTLEAGRPTTMGMRVVDADPAMSLRLWCRDDAYYANDLLRVMYQVRADGRTLTAAQMDERMRELRDCFDNIEKIAPMAMDQFALHLKRYPENVTTHTKHIQETAYLQAMGRADKVLAEGLWAWHNNQRKLTPALAQPLAKAITLYDTAAQEYAKFLDIAFPQVPGQPNFDRTEFLPYLAAIRMRQEGLRAMLVPDNKNPSTEFLRAITVQD